MTTVREIVLYVRHRGQLCCAAAAPVGARLGLVLPYPQGSDSSRVDAVLAELPALVTPGMEAWAVERLAEIAPLVCSVGGHPVDVAALTLKISKGSVWS